MAACTDSCAGNGTCQAAALVGGWCFTRMGLVSIGNDSASHPAWLSLPKVSEGGTTWELCLRLPLLAPPPLFVCAQGHDTPGSNIAVIARSDPAACRSACLTLGTCSVFSLYTNGTCALRSRAFFSAPEADGQAGRSSGVAMSCVHSRRIMRRLLPPEIAPASFAVRMGALTAEGELTRGFRVAALPRPNARAWA